MIVISETGLISVNFLNYKMFNDCNLYPLNKKIHPFELMLFRVDSWDVLPYVWFTLRF